MCSTTRMFFFFSVFSSLHFQLVVFVLSLNHFVVQECPGVLKKWAYFLIHTVSFLSISILYPILFRLLFYIVAEVGFGLADGLCALARKCLVNRVIPFGSRWAATNRGLFLLFDGDGVLLLYGH